ncbi:hypothetical protein BWQ96_06782 [Gracilariopsis chorda]|uniref:Uncharacterized protein n=1 Tax=Gracilariopsis chorda TaxID=448386 RepID=A0A2V3IN67_9FLOR|nr:hypothetical protein BWQ96_06782 [Gracilariopsis chorda]|eukprot:PXF43489.1 hypothetical protein BWQ96_06782 [Gracilariopsis chorda]
MTMKGATVIPPNATDKQMAELFMPLYVEDREKFMRAVTMVKHANRHTRPLFSTNVELSSIPKVPENEVEAFKEKYINTNKLKWGTPEATERCESNGRPVQYLRWRWALDNFDTYINMLRVYGHDDEKIGLMLKGVPMCLKSREAFDELRTALKKLSVEIAEEMEWKNVGFVFTGSSVPGFSQNPLKGLRDIPSKITDPKKSDVDICIVADGINVSVAKCHSDGDQFLEPKYAFPTTVNEITSGMRFGCKDLAEFCKSAAAFYEKWSEILPGGLQFTFCEDDTDIPPWEARINIRDI